MCRVAGPRVALGERVRGEEVSDICALDAVTEAWAEQGYELTELFVLLAQSPQFTTRQPSADPDAESKE